MARPLSFGGRPGTGFFLSAPQPPRRYRVVNAQRLRYDFRAPSILNASNRARSFPRASCDPTCARHPASYRRRIAFDSPCQTKYRVTNGSINKHLLLGNEHHMTDATTSFDSPHDHVDKTIHTSIQPVVRCRLDRLWLLDRFSIVPQINSVTISPI
jgi:hypothetical protein